MWHILGTEHVYIARPPYWHRISIFQYWHRDAVSKAIRHNGNRESGTPLGGLQDKDKIIPNGENKEATVNINKQDFETGNSPTKAMNSQHENQRQEFDIASQKKQRQNLDIALHGFWIILCLSQAAVAATRVNPKRKAKEVIPMDI